MDWQSMSANEAEAMAAGMYAGERAAKRAAMKPAVGGFDNASPETRLITAERKTQRAHTAILNNGGAGSAEATQAHAAWMAARTARATF